MNVAKHSLYFLLRNDDLVLKYGALTVTKLSKPANFS